MLTLFDAQLVVIAVALGQNRPTLALGNLIGSSIANILASFSLGLFFMRTSTFDRSSKIYSAVLLALTSVFLVALYAVPARLKWLAGLALMGAFVVYVGSVASLIYRGTLTAPEDDSDSDSVSDSDGSSSSSSSKDEDEAGVIPEDSDSDLELQEKPGGPDTAIALNSLRHSMLPHAPRKSRKMRPVRTIRSRPKPMWTYLLRLIVGFIALMVSSYVIAHSAGTLGSELGLSSTVVGTTILSLATTLPEKFVAILGGMRHQPGIMVANTVGSNIFLVTLCAGIMFFWASPEQLEGGFTAFEAMVMWASSALIFVIVLGGGRWWMGPVFLALYIAFLIFELANGRAHNDD